MASNRRFGRRLGLPFRRCSAACRELRWTTEVQAGGWAESTQLFRLSSPWPLRCHGACGPVGRKARLRMRTLLRSWVSRAARGKETHRLDLLVQLARDSVHLEFFHRMLCPRPLRGDA
eukprot:scaffold2262_cov262-Pinguiococcus_pyrenoidosus.AAC.8